MPKRKKNPTDPILLAREVVEAAIGEPLTTKPSKEKNPAAVALGRLGGLKGGPARAKKLSKEKQTEIARKAAIARWSKS
ncbi:MAG: hypothetical protein AABZ09_05775 [Candidatus Binatota bacterium]|jgi:hypothetical protein